MILTTTPCNFLVILSSLSRSSISFAISRGDTFASASGIFVFSFKAKRALTRSKKLFVLNSPLPVLYDSLSIIHNVSTVVPHQC